MNCIVIPVYKEKEMLENRINIINQICNKNDIILLVDDSKEFESKGFERSSIRVFPRTGKRRGYGMSLKQGLMIATYILNAGYIIQMDIDHNPDDLKKIKNIRKGQDVIIGIDQHTGKRKIIKIISDFLCRKLLGLNYVHPTCGFRMYRNEVLRNIEWFKVKSKGFGIQIELLYLIQRKKYKVYEMKLIGSKRKYGKSKANLSQMISWIITFRRLLSKHIYTGILQLITGK
jgi:dolichol-phosphate mannosyltransferase